MEHLVKKAQHENDAESFIQLMELNRQSMLKVARSYLTSEQDVADAMQDTILTCYEKLHTLQQPQYFKTWLIRIVINRCKDILRQNHREELPGELEAQAVTDESFADVEFRELLQQIDEKYRTILVLYYVEGLTVRQIAEKEGVRHQNVTKRIIHAKNILKKFLQSGVPNQGKNSGK